ncbi:MAG: NUDIX domain-containing protein [Candidatus Liptonbacteria bacterium]|nr:NUDIX domain-containing protein [Candidatus Liptonbacteria bacterium]
MKRFAIGILARDGKLLAERRSMSKQYAPGMVIFPGGHIEEGETPHEAMIREMEEELGVRVVEYHPLGVFEHKNGDAGDAYLVLRWEGEPEAHEAEELVWITSEEELSPKREFDKRIFRKVRAVEAGH